MNEFGKYRLFRKYVSLDGVEYTPLDEYQALLVENNSCQCGYREIEYRFDGEYKNETLKKYEIWNEYSFCPTDSSYDELTGNVDYRNPTAADGVILAKYVGNGKFSVTLCNTYFYEKIYINNVEKGKKYKEYTFNNTKINEVAYTNVPNILDGFFKHCDRLISIIIPNTVTIIGDGTFINCASLKSFNIPDSVTSIGYLAFSDCSDLTSVNIPNSVTSIGSGAFSRTPFDNNLPNGDIYLGSCYYKYKGEMPSNTSITIKDGTKGIAGGSFENCSGLTSVTIPDSVTNIGDCAFQDCTSLTSITIPDSVTIIDDSAFYRCSGLTEIVIPDSVTYIGDYSFFDCSSLSSVSIGSGVTSIYQETFTYCYSLTSITIPDNVTSIGDYAFRSCGLKSVEIGNGVISIGTSAFTNCYSLTSITIPDNVTSIGDSAFHKCSGLTSVTIGSGVKDIGEQSFYYCSGLTSVTIGSSVTTIGYQAFFGCKNLNSITCYAKKSPSFGHNSAFETETFNYLPTNGTLHVPNGSDYSRWLMELPSGWTIEYI